MRYQVVFLLLFFGLLFLAGTGRMGRYPVALFLEADPLIALGSALASHVVFAGLALALVVVILTLIFGRVFCSFLCPLGVINHAISAIPWPRKRRASSEANRWRQIYQTMHYVLIAFWSWPPAACCRSGWSIRSR
jgi:polyferredoxin